MSDTALLLIDLQNDYFPGGRYELHGTPQAAAQAHKLLTVFREKKLPIVHVRHESLGENAPFFTPGTEGAEIEPSLVPIAAEPVVVKHQINSFRETDLQELLNNLGIKRIIVAGAMSHMCIDAATRAATDLGYECSVAHDACATRDLEFNGTKVPAEQVHAAFMSALSFAYANVIGSDELIAELS